MIYILIILFLLYYISKYDVADIGKLNKSKKTAYLFISVCLIAISSFQYRMGADVVVYMNEYNLYSVNFDWEYLNGYERRLPGWVLLNVLCRTLTDDFVLLKAIISCFVNGVILHFFWRQGKYPFLCVFVYFISFYLPLNFNILRESITIALFVLAYPSLQNKKYLKYLLYAIIAFSFHEAAVFFILVLFFSFFDVSNKKFNVAVIACVIALQLFIYLLPNINETLIVVSTLFGDTLESRGDRYLEDSLYSSFHLTFIGFIQIFIEICIFLAIYYFHSKVNHTNKNSLERNTFLLFIIIYILNNAFPIFYRFYQYLYPIYAVVVSTVIIQLLWTRFRKEKILFFTVFLLIFGYIHLGNLFRNVPGTNVKLLVQYYPYYSVFDKNVDYERERVWGGKEDINYIR